jgi:hypothetical protein
MTPARFLPGFSKLEAMERAVDLRKTMVVLISSWGKWKAALRPKQSGNDHAAC